MRARFHVKGLIVRSEDHLVIFGDILEGSIRAGMQVCVPLNASLSVNELIRSIEFLDDIEGSNATYIGLGVSIADDARGLWDGITLSGEMLDVFDPDRMML